MEVVDYNSADDDVTSLVNSIGRKIKCSEDTPNNSYQMTYGDIVDSPLFSVVPFICLFVGVPGNLLSARVWLRASVTVKNPSAVYLGTLAIVDLAALVLMLLPFEMYVASQVFIMLDYLGVALLAVISVKRFIFYRFPLQAERCNQICCAMKSVIGLTLCLLAILAVQISIPYLTEGVESSANKWFEAVLLLEFRVTLPMALLGLNVVLIVDAYRKHNATKELNAMSQTEQQVQNGEDQCNAATAIPPTPAVPVSLLVTVVLIYILLDTTSTVLYTIIYFVPHQVWCEKDSRPTVAVVEKAYLFASQVGLLVFVYKFLVYVVCSAEFRAGLKPRTSCCRCKSARDVCEVVQCCVETMNEGDGGDGDIEMD